MNIAASRTDAQQTEYQREASDETQRLAFCHLTFFHSAPAMTLLSVS